MGCCQSKRSPETTERISLNPSRPTRPDKMRVRERTNHRQVIRDLYLIKSEIQLLQSNANNAETLKQLGERLLRRERFIKENPVDRKDDVLQLVQELKSELSAKKSENNKVNINVDLENNHQQHDQAKHDLSNANNATNIVESTSALIDLDTYLQNGDSNQPSRESWANYRQLSSDLNIIRSELQSLDQKADNVDTLKRLRNKVLLLDKFIEENPVDHVDEVLQRIEEMKSQLWSRDNTIVDNTSEEKLQMRFQDVVASANNTTNLEKSKISLTDLDTDLQPVDNISLEPLKSVVEIANNTHRTLQELHSWKNLALQQENLDMLELELNNLRASHNMDPTIVQGLSQRLSVIKTNIDYEAPNTNHDRYISLQDKVESADHLLSLIKSDLDKFLSFKSEVVSCRQRLSDPINNTDQAKELQDDFEQLKASLSQFDHRGGLRSFWDNLLDQYLVELDDIFKSLHVDQSVEVEHLDINNQFNDFDFRAIKYPVGSLEYVRVLNKRAHALDGHVHGFTGAKHSVAWFILDEKLLQVVEHLDKVKVTEEENREVFQLKHDTIVFINKLHAHLDNNNN